MDTLQRSSSVRTRYYATVVNTGFLPRGAGNRSDCCERDLCQTGSGLFFSAIAVRGKAAARSAGARQCSTLQEENQHAAIQNSPLPQARNAAAVKRARSGRATWGASRAPRRTLHVTTHGVGADQETHRDRRPAAVRAGWQARAT